MRRGELVAIAASITLGGCMRIYQDPDLPDVVTEWLIDDCQPGTGNVTLALISIDAGTRTEVSVPCTDERFTFSDVARERYRFEGLLLDDAGEAFSRADGEVDLRDGLDEKLSLYFGGFSNFRVAWTFDMAATCESLGADLVYLYFTEQVAGPSFQTVAPCWLTPYFGMIPDGTYTLRLVARSEDGPAELATSLESEEFTIEGPDLLDLGVLTLSP